MNQFENQFYNTYREELRRAIMEYPTEYAYSVDQSDQVCDRMILAFKSGSFNKDSRAIKATCKLLGIKHTYKAISNYFKTGIKG